MCGPFASVSRCITCEPVAHSLSSFSKLSMGLFSQIWRWLGWTSSSAPGNPGPIAKKLSTPSRAWTRSVRDARKKRKYIPLAPLHFRRKTDVSVRHITGNICKTCPYPFARLAVLGGYLDLSRDTNVERLERFQLPIFSTPEELAKWLDLPLGRVAWLAHRFEDGNGPPSEHKAHYTYHWIPKRKAGFRLVEAPKSLLKGVQHKILREILDHVPVHASCHGFTAGRSIVSNAAPHVGRRVVLKLDLENFYPSVSYNRVVAIYRALGYSREVSIWLALLSTSKIPPRLHPPRGNPKALRPYSARHLPQGAPTSPALANLSAFALDLRLAGLARCFHAKYSRYADDLTFSGPKRFLTSLRIFLPLVKKILRSEKFKFHPQKLKILRNNQRQCVTGVVVNERLNVGRKEYDLLKAILHNCVRSGPASQNHGQLPNFAEVLRGRIAHVQLLNAERGARLLAQYQKIDWLR